MKVDTTTPFGREAAKSRSLYDGIQYRFEFPNGYGASVVRHTYSYGSNAGLWELGVTVDEHLTYESPITDDVIGYLTETDVAETLDRIAALPAVTS